MLYKCNGQEWKKENIFFFTFIDQVFSIDRFYKKVHQTVIVHHVLAPDIVIRNGFREEKPYYFDKLYWFIILIWSAKFLSDFSLGTSEILLCVLIIIHHYGKE